MLCRQHSVQERSNLLYSFFSPFFLFFLFFSHYIHFHSFSFCLFFQQHAYLNVNTFFHSIANKKKVTQTFIHFFLFTLLFMYTRLRSKEKKAQSKSCGIYSNVFSFSAISNCRKYQKNAETTMKKFLI